MLSTHFWKKYFKVYDILNELYPYQDLADTIIKNLDIQTEDTVLDLGSGTGNIAMLVKKRGGDVVGIDFSPIGVMIHQKKDPTADLRVLDVRKKLPFGDMTFDKIYSNNTLYTISREERKQIFNELYRVLKKDGKIVISNVVEGFKPLAIYKDHIHQSVNKIGYLKTGFKMINFIIPTIKILYYNRIIIAESNMGSYDFFKNGEQAEMLKSANFVNISPDISVYSKQGILNSARK